MSRIFCAPGSLLLPKFECDSSAALGHDAEALHLVRCGNRDLGELCGRRVDIDVGVHEEDLPAPAGSAVHGRVGLRPAFLPMTWSM